MYTWYKGSGMGGPGESGILMTRRGQPETEAWALLDELRRLKHPWHFLLEGHSVDLFLKYLFLKGFFLAGSKNRFQNRYLFCISRQCSCPPGRKDLFWKLFLTDKNRVRDSLFNEIYQNYGWEDLKGCLRNRQIKFMWTYITNYMFFIQYCNFYLFLIFFILLIYS